jgi:predicted PurR-regulated permease PerM
MTDPTRDPPPDPQPAAIGGGAAEVVDPTAAPSRRTRPRTVPGQPIAAAGGGGWFGWVRRLAKLWGFLGFCVLVLILFRHVIVPFIFAILLAYILAPLVRRMSQSPDGRHRMPRGLAIILCYIVLLAFMGLFLVALLPRLSEDIARIGREAPALYEKLNNDWAPRAAGWLERRFPSLAPPAPVAEVAPPVADVPLPPGTQFVITPLPDGRYAIELMPSGVRVKTSHDGHYAVVPSDEPPEDVRTVDRMRALAARGLMALQAELDDVFRFGRRLLSGVIEFIFKFFLVLMIAAFLLLDLERIHVFARGLVPSRHRADYDVVAAGIDRGLSGVIRGQLLICLVNGLLTYIGLLVFDVKYALVLAVVAALLSLIPIFGSILSTVPIVMAALVSGEQGIDVMRGLFITAWIIGIHFLEANLLNPKILGTAAKIHPVLVIFALLAGEHTYGLVGALLAVPVAAIIQVLFVFFRRKAWKVEGAPV